MPHETRRGNEILKNAPAAIEKVFRNIVGFRKLRPVGRSNWLPS
ncbi:MAG: hypothetical protein OJF50_005318 [Nitrospira sp.]|nr:hypothetical protein [Nitrospira sp.]